MPGNIVASRQCSVGPNGYFRHGADHGPVTVALNFYRPILHPEQGPDLFPAHQCTYEIKYGADVVHTSSADGMDEVAALLAAMRNAVMDLEHRYLEEWDVFIPPEYLGDMRATESPGRGPVPRRGNAPTSWIAQHEVLWIDRHGVRTVGKIAIGSPEHVGGRDARCIVSMNAHRASHRVHGSSTLHALALALHYAGREVQSFIEGGGRVLHPTNGSDLGPLLEAMLSRDSGKLAEPYPPGGGDPGVPAKPWLVEMPVTWIVNGARVPGLIAVGVPELVPGGDGEATCPVALDGLQRNIAVHGEGAFHALLLAIKHIEARLRDATSEGMRVIFPGEDEDPESATESLLAIFRPFDAD